MVRISVLLGLVLWLGLFLVRVTVSIWHSLIKFVDKMTSLQFHRWELVSTSYPLPKLFSKEPGYEVVNCQK